MYSKHSSMDGSKKKKMINKIFTILLILSPASLGFASDMSAEIEKATQAILPKVIEWRRHIHQYPELSNREENTAKFIADYLKTLNIEVRTGIAIHGVVGVLKGAQPGPVIGLRADMDALPVLERNSLPFRSKVTSTYNNETVPVMHACGHDAHVAMLMGTATVLSSMRDKIKGSVVFIFQPAEEGAPEGEEGGAKLMVKEGVMDKPKIDAIFGIHISSVTEVGQIKFKSGGAMASSDILSISVKGRGAHGAYPWLGVDPIVTSAQIILGLQTIVSRRSELTKSPVIITIGKISAGVRNNIIPEEATMVGTIRVLDSAMQKETHEQIKLTAKKIAESMGATAEVKITTQYPVVYNTPELVKKTLPSLNKAVGTQNVIEAEWATGAEDFSFYGAKAPALFFWVGGMPKGKKAEDAASHHTPEFYIDDSRLDVGIKAFSNIVFDY